MWRHPRPYPLNAPSGTRCCHDNTYLRQFVADIVTLFTLRKIAYPPPPDILCFASQTPFPGGRRLVPGKILAEPINIALPGYWPMTVKYYTQFRLTDEHFRGGNEFSGVIELNQPMARDSDVADIEAVLARNFDLRRSSVKLLSWSRLH